MLCDKDDTYDGPNKIYPARHGVGCPGHYDHNRHFYIVGETIDPAKWWGRFDYEETIEPKDEYL